MNDVNKTASMFAKALETKNISLLKLVLHENCSWYTGKHFGIFAGAPACILHFQTMFYSFSELKFLLRRTSVSEKVSVFEYSFDTPANQQKLTPMDYLGVFILETPDPSKISRIRTYYEDRTSRPIEPEERSKTASRKHSAIFPKTELPYDPITGLPITPAKGPGPAKRAGLPAATTPIADAEVEQEQADAETKK